MLGLLALVLWVFVALFRRRARANIERMNLALPEALRQPRTPAATPRPASAVGPASRPVPVATPAQRPLHFMLTYDVGPDFPLRREAFRAEHLSLAWKSAEAGELVLAGALEEGSGQALLLFKGSRAAAERFAQSDPYVRHGLVRQWRVRQWHTTVGAEASLPMRAPPASP